MNSFQFIVDTREKRPYKLSGAVRSKLDAGDYSCKGCEKVMAVERKGFDDLWNCLTSSLPRFKKQLTKLGNLQYKALLIDTSVSSILLGHVMCKLPGEKALERLMRLCFQYEVPFYFVNAHGAQFVRVLLAHWWKEVEKNGQRKAK